MRCHVLDVHLKTVSPLVMLPPTVHTLCPCTTLFRSQALLVTMSQQHPSNPRCGQLREVAEIAERRVAEQTLLLWTSQCDEGLLRTEASHRRRCRRRRRTLLDVEIVEGGPAVVVTGTD